MDEDLKQELAEAKADNARLAAENVALREALGPYLYCRHAVEACFCTKEARAALSSPSPAVARVEKAVAFAEAELDVRAALTAQYAAGGTEDTRNDVSGASAACTYAWDQFVAADAACKGEPK